MDVDVAKRYSVELDPGVGIELVRRPPHAYPDHGTGDTPGPHDSGHRDGSDETTGTEKPEPGGMRNGSGDALRFGESGNVAWLRRLGDRNRQCADRSRADDRVRNEQRPLRLNEVAPLGERQRADASREAKDSTRHA